jgi:hypothetical protein
MCTAVSTSSTRPLRGSTPISRVLRRITLSTSFSVITLIEAQRLGTFSTASSSGAAFIA